MDIFIDDKDQNQTSPNHGEGEGDDDDPKGVELKKNILKPLKEADGMVRAGKFGVAIDLLTEALNLPSILERDEALIHSNLSFCYLEFVAPEQGAAAHILERWLAAALNEAKEVTTLLPHWYKGYYRLGQVYDRIGSMEKAKEYLQKALSLCPNNKAVLDSLSKISFDERRQNVSKYFPPPSAAHHHHHHQQQQHKRERSNKKENKRCDKMMKAEIVPASSLPDKFDKPDNMNLIYRIEEMGQIDDLNELPIENLRGMMEGRDDELAKIGFVICGHRHQLGVGVKLDIEKAAECYRVALEAGNMWGTFWLAKLYLLGCLEKYDNQWVVKALNLLQHAAQQPPINPKTMGFNRGVAESQYLLGKFLQDSPGFGKPDYPMAMFWYTKSAKNGCPASSTALGRMYRDGIGVTVDKGMAIKYFLFAGRLGDTTAMESLGWLYADEGDPTNAIKWYTQAIAKGDLNAVTHQKSFYDTIQRLQKYLKKVKSTFKGIKSKDEGLSKKEIRSQIFDGDSFSSFSSPSSSSMMAAAFMGTKNMDPTLLFNKCKKIEPHLLQFVLKNPTSYASTILRAMKNFEKAIAALTFCYQGVASITYDNVKKIRVTGVPPIATLAKLYDVSKKVMHHLAHTLRGAEVIANLDPCQTVLVKRLIAWTMGIHEEGRGGAIGDDEDCNARICSACLKMESPEKCLQFNMVSLQKYPDEKFFHRGRSNLLAFSGNFEQGIEETAASLKKFPNDPELLYARASMLKFLWGGNSKEKEKAKDVQNEYLKFLQWAPPDHKNVPDACFTVTMTILLVETDENDNENWLKYFRMGVKAEKSLYPCFLPFNSKTKEFVQELAQNRFTKAGTDLSEDFDESAAVVSMTTNFLEENKNYNESNNFMTIPSKEIFLDANLSMEKLTCEERLRVCLRHRRMVAKVFKNGGKNLQNPNFYQIEEDFEKSKNLDDHSTTLIIAHVIEDPITFTSHHGLRDDDDDDETPVITIQLVVMCQNSWTPNWIILHHLSEESRLEFKNKVKFASSLCIRDQYLSPERKDETLGFIVEDFKDIIFFENNTPHPGGQEVCRFCLRKGATLKCGKCRRVSYCGRECQVADWKVLKHKLICVPGLEEFI